MALGIYFRPVSMTTQKYDEVMRQLEAAGQGAPRGRLYHSCFGDTNNLAVYDVWDTQENFDAFGQVLMPILAGVGVDPGQPTVAPVHNIVVG